MKKFTCLFCMCALMCAFFTACDWKSGDPKTRAEEEPKDEEITDGPFTEYSLAGTSCKWINLNDGDVYEHYDGKLIVINNDEELKTYIRGDYPTVDFSKKTLLLAIGAAPHGISRKKAVQSLEEPSAGKYKWNIKIPLAMSDDIGKWVLAILVNKLNADSAVELDVTFEYARMPSE